MGQVGKSKLQRLRDAGCIPEGAAFDATDEDWIEQTLSDADIDAVIEIKTKLGTDFFAPGNDPQHFIFF